ncbi:glycosyltransferase [Vibrio cholerae]|uniref:glycosyltransferase n=1 Tax=Vibrio cholerae TaxID=666 RepID=UPI001C0FA304|nr:glycosyltransferase [Vibrio cholerae]EGR0260331.1 glycosyltransferase [Vibrio cholerae]EGR0494296.1 glycosyltransferase [Vibrio cholerae]EGR0557303.1 glycosyltransferase [Vibrio cholerae]EGR0679984.1 glycosyltransferase [Vibrio cholerae]EGR1035806.1 glycosyltransferase [Vibrio cholerae]
MYKANRNLHITTVVKDSSKHGGGMLAVAYSVHKYLCSKLSNASFISSCASCYKVENSWIVGELGIRTFFISNKAIGDITHVHGIWTPFEFFVIKAAKKRNSKIVVSPHGALEPWAFQSKGLKKRIAWYLYQKRILTEADLIIVNSQKERDNLRRLGLNGPIAVIPNGIILDGYDKQSAMKSEREKIILYFSRLDKKKGIELLIKAWRKVKDKRGYKLHIQGYGDQSYRLFLHDMVSKFGLEEEILFIDPSYDEKRWASFFSASFYILPSYSENFGITVAEALISGLPAITTTEMPWEDLTNEGIGWSVKCNESAIAEAITEAIGIDESKLALMRRRAVDYAEKHFSWETIVQDYGLAYQWVLSPDLESIPKSITNSYS